MCARSPGGRQLEMVTVQESTRLSCKSSSRALPHVPEAQHPPFPLVPAQSLKHPLPSLPAPVQPHKYSGPNRTKSWGPCSEPTGGPALSPLFLLRLGSSWCPFPPEPWYGHGFSALGQGLLMGATARLLRPLQMESGKNPHLGVFVYFLVLFISKALENLFE